MNTIKANLVVRIYADDQLVAEAESPHLFGETLNAILSIAEPDDDADTPTPPADAVNPPIAWAHKGEIDAARRMLAAGRSDGQITAAVFRHSDEYEPLYAAPPSAPEAVRVVDAEVENLWSDVWQHWNDLSDEAQDALMKLREMLDALNPKEAGR